MRDRIGTNAEAVMTVAAPVQDAPAEGGRHHDKYDRLVAAAQSLPKLKVAVAHPCDAASMSAVFEAAALGLIDPILVGPRAKIAAAADAIKKDPSPFRIVDAPHSHAAAEKAVEIVRLGEAEALMKGSLHTDELMAAVVSREGGLRTARRISHCFVMDVPGHENALVITDAAINIAPSLEDKVHIVQNAIDLVQALGIEPVRVAILSAMETVNPKVPSTLEAAALCKMADRGQITGGIVDGPLALDNAIDLGAAKIKKIESPVAGRRTFSSSPTSRPATCWQRASPFSPMPTPPESCSVRGCPSSSRAAPNSTVTRLASCAVASLVADAQRKRLGVAEV